MVHEFSVVLCVIVVVLRFYCIEKSFGLYFDDAIFLIIQFLYYFIGNRVIKNNKRLTIIITGICLVWVVFAVGDILLYNLLALRLDNYSYLGFLNSSTLHVFTNFLGEAILMLATIVIISISIYMLVVKRSWVLRVFASICIVLSLLSITSGVPIKGGLFQMKSFFSPVHIDFSNYLNPLRTYDTYFETIQGKKQRPNVIVVFAESMSSVDSLVYSGLFDNSPKFDALTASGKVFLNAVSNGCTSDSSHVSLLQGVEPRNYDTTKGLELYSAYTGYLPGLGDYFKSVGYDVSFLSTVSLDFLGQKDFLGKVGFSRLVSDELQKNNKKYTFNAPTDQVLYNEILKEVSVKTITPKFLVAQTISSHPPYLTPYGRNESTSLRFVDDSISDFIKQLRTQKYFDNGILIVVGDHRKFDPVSTQELEKFGVNALGKIIYYMEGKGITPGISNQIVQHTDIFSSLRVLTATGNIEVSSMYNDIFSQVSNRNWGIRYCVFRDKDYVVTMQDGKSFYLSQSPFLPGREYIAAHKEYFFPTGSGAQQNTPIRKQRTRKSEFEDVKIFGHGGSPAQETYNSISGFTYVWREGGDGIEFDVSMTKDGVNIILHGSDNQLGKTICDKKYKLTESTYQFIYDNCPLENGEKIHTLEEMLLKVGYLFDKVILELKVWDPKRGEEQFKKALATIQALGLQDHVIFITYDPETRELLGKTPGIIPARDTFDVSEFQNEYVQNNYKYRLTAISTFSEDIQTLARKNNIPLAVYPIYTTGEFQNLYDQGVRTFLVDNVPLIMEYVSK